MDDDTYDNIPDGQFYEATKRSMHMTSPNSMSTRDVCSRKCLLVLSIAMVLIAAALLSVVLGFALELVELKSQVSVLHSASNSSSQQQQQQTTTGVSPSTTSGLPGEGQGTQATPATAGKDSYNMYVPM